MVLAKLIQAADIRAQRPRARCRLRHRLCIGHAWPGLRAPSWRSNRMPRWRVRRRQTCARVGADNVTVVVGPLTEGWADGRPLRRHPAQRLRPRSLPKALVAAAQGWGPAGRRSRPCAARQGHALSRCRRRMQRPADLRCGGTAPAWFCAAAELRILIPEYEHRCAASDCGAEAPAFRLS